eukprot:Awhi_evm3s15042
MFLQPYKPYVVAKKKQANSHPDLLQTPTVALKIDKSNTNIKANRTKKLKKSNDSTLSVYSATDLESDEPNNDNNDSDFDEVFSSIKNFGLSLLSTPSSEDLLQVKRKTISLFSAPNSPVPKSQIGLKESKSVEFIPVSTIYDESVKDVKDTSARVAKSFLRHAKRKKEVWDPEGSENFDGILNYIGEDDYRSYDIALLKATYSEELESHIFNNSQLFDSYKSLLSPELVEQ